MQCDVQPAAPRAFILYIYNLGVRRERSRDPPCPPPCAVTGSRADERRDGARGRIPVVSARRIHRSQLDSHQQFSCIEATMKDRTNVESVGGSRSAHDASA